MLVNFSLAQMNQESGHILVIGKMKEVVYEKTVCLNIESSKFVWITNWAAYHFDGQKINMASNY